jgi:hypothetical protein
MIYIYERGVPRGVLNLNSTSYSDHGRYGDLPLQGKIATAEPGIEPGTSPPKHEAGQITENNFTETYDPVGCTCFPEINSQKFVVKTDGIKAFM